MSQMPARTRRPDWPALIRRTVLVLAMAVMYLVVRPPAADCDGALQAWDSAHGRMALRHASLGLAAPPRPDGVSSMGTVAVSGSAGCPSRSLADTEQRLRAGGEASS